MSLEIPSEEFSEADHVRFAARLQESLEALALLLARPEFGIGPTTVGAELELAIVDATGRPLPVNRAVLADAVDARIALELDRFNLEVNARPVSFTGRPFGALAAELTDALAAITGAAEPHGGRPIAIGILPTLDAGDLQPGMLTDSHRYRALSAALRRLRHEPFRIRIDGEDPLDVQCDDVTFEGANTSLQLHLRVAPPAFADTFNAAQIATAPVLAAAGNSPLLLGRRLWEETRVALFRQAVDDRVAAAEEDWRPARVSFGHGWVRRGAFELFAENVTLHPPLLPVVGDEDPIARARAGAMPALDELRLHHGTIWSWNRAVYDPTAGGHLRIELRALPAGPSVVDMVANAAFLIGLTRGLAPGADRLVSALTFGQARRNFYEAARRGLDAELLWPSPRPPSPRRVPAARLVEELLPVARDALVHDGVDPAEADGLLAVVAARAASRRTGARWQREVLARLERRQDRPAALRALVLRYLALSGSGRPVHEWPVDA
jgi:gamma-glutamyl:cysteine ligase YbdK (ATP-grasp superfamily)